MSQTITRTSPGYLSGRAWAKRFTLQSRQAPGDGYRGGPFSCGLFLCPRAQPTHGFVRGFVTRGDSGMAARNAGRTAGCGAVLSSEHLVIE